MKEVSLGGLIISSITKQPDREKHYRCYWCEEEIEFSLPSEERRKWLVDKGRNLEPEWRNTKDGYVACGTFATPSNLEVPIKEK